MLDITEAEREVLLLAAEGHPKHRIAAIRGTSLHTVKTQVESALKKLGARHTAHAVAMVLRDAR